MIPKERIEQLHKESVVRTATDSKTIRHCVRCLSTDIKRVAPESVHFICRTCKANTVPSLVHVTPDPLFRVIARCTSNGSNPNDDLAVFLPSGSGFDRGSRIGEAKRARFEVCTSYHHMNDVGMYVGWTDITARVTPNFDGDINVKFCYHGSKLVSRYAAKDYIEDTVYDALNTPIYVNIRPGTEIEYVNMLWVNQG